VVIFSCFTIKLLKISIPFKKGIRYFFFSKLKKFIDYTNFDKIQFSILRKSPFLNFSKFKNWMYTLLDNKYVEFTNFISFAISVFLLFEYTIFQENSLLIAGCAFILYCTVIIILHVLLIANDKNHWPLFDLENRLLVKEGSHQESIFLYKNGKSTLLDNRVVGATSFLGFAVSAWAFIGSILFRSKSFVIMGTILISYCLMNVILHTLLIAMKKRQINKSFFG